MWSKHLAPKPKDWPDHVDIVGAFVDKETNITPSTLNASDPMDLFLSKEGGRPPIFVGFGSMVVESPETLIKVLSFL